MFIPVHDGYQIFVKTWDENASSAKYPIILFHDSLGCTEMWRDFPEQLAQATGRKVISYDRLGFGQSSQRIQRPSMRFVNEEGEKIIPEIMKAFNLKKAVLFGHSVGGAMALASASVHPELCEAVISESAQVFVEDRTVSGILVAAKNFEDPNEFAKLKKYHGLKSRWVLLAWVRRWLSFDFANWSLQEDLRGVKCPVLVIHGDKDEFGSVKFPEMICEILGSKVQKEILSDCGHVPHREKPTIVLEKVSDFLKDLS